MIANVEVIAACGALPCLDVACSRGAARGGPRMSLTLSLRLRGNPSQEQSAVLRDCGFGSQESSDSRSGRLFTRSGARGILTPRNFCCRMRGRSSSISERRYCCAPKRPCLARSAHQAPFRRRHAPAPQEACSFLCSDAAAPEPPPGAASAAGPRAPRRSATAVLDAQSPAAARQPARGPQGGAPVTGAMAVRKRVLSPHSVYDEPAVSAAFAAAGVKELHVSTLYKWAPPPSLCASGESWLIGAPDCTLYAVAPADLQADAALRCHQSAARSLHFCNLLSSRPFRLHT